MKSDLFLVTGGFGFIGSHLVEKLLALDHKVIVIDDLSSGKRNNLVNVKNHKNLKIIIKKIQNVDDKIFKGIKGVFHLAAQTSVQKSIQSPINSSSNNILGTLKIFEAAKKNAFPIVYASTSALYGNLKKSNDYSEEIDLISPYAFDKYSMELYAQVFANLFKTRSIGLRFFNVYGPRQDPNNDYSGVISIFTNQLLKNKTIKIFGGNQTRDFVFVSDVVNSIITSMRILKYRNVCESINVGSKKETSIKDLHKILKEKIKSKSKVKYLKLLKGDPMTSNGVFKKLKSVLNMSNKKFMDLDSGLDKTILYMRKNDE